VTKDARTNGEASHGPRSPATTTVAREPMREPETLAGEQPSILPRALETAGSADVPSNRAWPPCCEGAGPLVEYERLNALSTSAPVRSRHSTFAKPVPQLAIEHTLPAMAPPYGVTIILAFMLVAFGIVMRYLPGGVGVMALATPELL